jgi:hypothetical protein
MSNIDIFYRAILQRSQENEKALKYLMQEQLYSLIGSIIRLELDSLIRVCYVKSQDAATQEVLIEQFMQGRRWRYERDLITDKQMVENMVWTLGLGWAAPIYTIGCAFIHLSPYHDWGNSEPTNNFSQDERAEIIEHIEGHHKIKLSDDFTFFDLVNVAPKVFEKLKSNLRYEIGTQE